MKKKSPPTRTIDVGGDFDGNSFERFESNADEFARIGGNARDNEFSDIRHRPWRRRTGEPAWWTYLVGLAGIVAAVVAVAELL
jgi:hypothetical protein